MNTNAAPIVHPTAIVDSSTKIAPGVRIGPYCVIGPEVTIGAGSVLHNHVTIHGPCRIGIDNVFYPYAVIGAEPQDLKYHGERTEVLIGDRNRIREHATIHRGTEQGGGKTVIGNDCLLMVNAHIAHDCIIEDEVVIANNVMLGGHCLVEFGATVAGAAGVHHFSTIGKLSFVGGMARISKDVPPFIVVEGNPAEPRKLNTTALIRRSWPVEEVEALRAAYKALYRNPDEPMQSAIARLRQAPGQVDPVLKLCDSLERIHMGVHGRGREVSRHAASPRR